MSSTCHDSDCLHHTSDKSSAAKTADLILVMLDATKSEEQRRLLEIELDAVGIRLNKKKPDVVFKKRTTGGVCAALVSSE